MTICYGTSTRSLAGCRQRLPWAWPLFCLAASLAPGSEPRPIDLAIPIVRSADASNKQLAAARESGRGYLIDLTLGNEGPVFQAKPELSLDPGRYRLHVLVGASPAENDVVDPVELQLDAGSGSRHVLPREISKTNELSEIVLDFVVTGGKPVPIAAKWLVGDSLLQVPPQEKFHARQKLLVKRRAQIDKAKLAGQDTIGGALDQPAASAERGLALEDKAQAPVPELLKAATLKYRLAIADVHVEALCPVGIERVQTDKAAYEPGDSVQLAVTLRNFSRSEVQVALAAGLEPADKQTGAQPGERRTASVTVPAGDTLTHAFPEPLSTRGLGSMTRIPVSASWKDARPAAAETLLAILPPKREARPLQKKIFAHYMGCWPAGTGPLFDQRQNEGKELRHDAPSSSAAYFGGHVRNFDLVDPAKHLTPEDSADLEIRRALRIGIDGFAIDAWAGGMDAKRTLDALFNVAEAKDYPFEITICLDPCCGGDLVGSVKELLQKHGKSPKLARREGRPLVLGYNVQLLRHVGSPGGADHPCRLGANGPDLCRCGEKCRRTDCLPLLHELFLSGLRQITDQDRHADRGGRHPGAIRAGHRRFSMAGAGTSGNGQGRPRRRGGVVHAGGHVPEGEHPL